jgi:uncharacterized protein
MWERGRLVSKVREGKEEAGAKFADYFDFAEPLTRIPSHRALAMFRGEKEEMLDLVFDPEPEDAEPGAPAVRSGYEVRIAQRFGLEDLGRPADRWLLDTARWAWRTRILIRLGVDLRMRLWQNAEDEAVRVFAANLRDLLLAAPPAPAPRWASTRACAPAPRSRWSTTPARSWPRTRSTRTCRTASGTSRSRSWPSSARHKVDLVAIGNGTASRETDKLALELIAKHPELKLTKVMVSEAGASVYSASAYASAELPELDVSLRGAVSIARRLQDPLAELVKIDPKSIGVGQYQHDLAETKLSRSLDAVVEDCVNGVGVDVNTASVPLLTRVSGIGESLARRRSSRTGTATARSAPARRSSRCRGSARRPSSSARASCASRAATTRWTAPRCTPRPTRWSAGSSPRPAATSGR